MSAENPGSVDRQRVPTWINRNDSDADHGASREIRHCPTNNVKPFCTHDANTFVDPWGEWCGKCLEKVGEPEDLTDAELRERKADAEFENLRDEGLI